MKSAAAVLAAAAVLCAETPWIFGFIPTYRISVIPKMNMNKITHLAAAFANPDSSGTVSIGMDVKKFADQCRSKGVKPLVSIGGGGSYSWGADTTIYSHLYADSNRTAFVNSLIKFADTNGLAGIDNDIEGSSLQHKGYDRFTCELADSLHAHGMILTAAIGVDAWAGAANIDDSTLQKMDLITTMSYGGVGAWNWNKPSDEATFKKFSDDMNYFASRGVDSSKIGGGIPFYGSGYPKKATSNFNSYYNTWSSYLSDTFYVKQDPWTHDTLINRDSMPEYCCSWSTVKKKLEYAKSFGGGVMIWEVGQDNYSGTGPNMIDSMTVYLGGTTGISTPSRRPSIVTGAPVRAELFTISGRKIRSSEISGSFSPSEFTAGAVPGSYVIRTIDQAGTVSIQKLRKE